MLAGSSTTAFAAANDSALTVDHLLQKVKVLVIDVHRTRALPIDEDWIFLTSSASSASPLSGAAASAHWTWRHSGVSFKLMGEWSDSGGAKMMLASR